MENLSATVCTKFFSLINLPRTIYPIHNILKITLWPTLTSLFTLDVTHQVLMTQHREYKNLQKNSTCTNSYYSNHSSPSINPLTKSFSNLTSDLLWGHRWPRCPPGPAWRPGCPPGAAGGGSGWPAWPLRPRSPPPRSCWTWRPPGTSFLESDYWQCNILF